VNRNEERIVLRRLLVSLALTASCALPLASAAATPAPKPVAAPAAPPASARNDYANPAFTAPLGEGLRAFYGRDFAAARKGFQAALAVVPDNTLAMSFLNATAAQTPGELDTLLNAEEDALAKDPKSALAHVRLGFTYLFASLTGRDRTLTRARS
jgi:hypothetical protein